MLGLFPRSCLFMSSTLPQAVLGTGPSRISRRAWPLAWGTVSPILGPPGTLICTVPPPTVYPLPLGSCKSCHFRLSPTRYTQLFTPKVGLGWHPALTWMRIATIQGASSNKQTNKQTNKVPEANRSHRAEDSHQTFLQTGHQRPTLKK